MIRNSPNTEARGIRVHQTAPSSAVRLAAATTTSMILGRVAIEEAKRLVSMPVVVAGDGVRYTIVGALRKAGFVVEHTPNQGNAKHVSVRTAGEVWGDDHAARFAQCFTEEPVFAEAGARHGR